MVDQTEYLFVTYVPIGEKRPVDRWTRCPVVRVPLVGEFVRLPDDIGLWRVVSVDHDYLNGLAFTPKVVIEIAWVHS